MISLSSVYFLVYFLMFLVVGLLASMLIIPLLTVSFAFASCVVVFGFLSDLTFKFAQVIYFKTDRRLKSTLGKMGTHTRKNDSGRRPQVIKNYASARTRSSSQASSAGAGPGAMSVPVPMPRALETRADMRVTS